jgi:hypothetical protein
MRAQLLAAASLFAFCSAAVAQPVPAPPIKPGLWQVQSDRAVDGKPAPDIGAHLKNLQPEVRKRMEAGMRARGIDIGTGDGTMKMCMTRESLDQGQWQGTQERCKTDFKTRSASVWTWHSSCSQPAAESDGEARFADAENYTVKSSTTLNVQGKTQTSTMALAAKWLGADCGDLPPMRAMPAPGKVGGK